jgi:HlyD family secretion protein
MRRAFKVVLILAVVGGIAAAASAPMKKYFEERSRPKFRTAEVDRGAIKLVVNSTGTIQPVLSVQVGAFVSGPIAELHVEYNDEVEAGELLAEIDSRIYDASVARDEAALAIRDAEVNRTKARLQQAINDEQRAIGLRSDNEDFISDSEMDQYRFARMALEAELVLAEAGVVQAQANLNNSRLNQSYAKITAPVSGIIIDRKISPGQTLTSQFQTPELFVIAPDMREEMHIIASVDETDIGLLRRAQEEGQPVEFRVDAYPGELFAGTIWQIRLSPTTTQNVVTYPVVISAPNPDLKLLPGMTADITFLIEEKPDIVRIPNTALRYFPEREHVREADRELLDGVREEREQVDDLGADQPPASEQVAADIKQRTRHVWVKEGHLLRAVEVTTGISDYKFTELVSGELKAGDELVIGLETTP